MQSDAGREAGIVTTKYKTATSGRNAERSQLTESADEAPNRRMYLSQLHKASKCPILSSHLGSKMKEARATSLNRMSKSQPCNHWPYTLYKGLSSPQSTIRWRPRGRIQYITHLHPCPRAQEAEDRNKCRRKTICKGFAGALWPKNDSCSMSMELIVMKDHTNPSLCDSLSSRISQCLERQDRQKGGNRTGHQNE